MHGSIQLQMSEVTMTPLRPTDRSRILIVQSDPDVCVALRDSLEPEGYRIDTVGYGRAAVEHLETASYEAVLLDMCLPDFDGLSALKRIKETDSTLPVIILTGFYDADTPAHALAEGAFAFMLMPYSSSEMKTVLRDAIAIRALLTVIERDQSSLMRRAFTVSDTIEVADDAVVLTDDEHRILFLNSAAERLFSYGQQEIIDKDVRLLFGDRYRAITPADLPLTQTRRPGPSIRQAAHLEGRRKDGKEFPLELSSLSWKINGSVFHTYLISEMSDGRHNSGPYGDVNVPHRPLHLY
jgi:PAS domain S-box-containing protein